jgi:glycerophosphoryl diester phosphodiesterase
LKKFLLLALPACGILFLYFPAGLSAAARPVSIAHRGANLEADENTLKAFALAAKEGVDFIETDPRLTKDGVFVVLHDADPERMTGHMGELSKMTLAEVRQLRTKNGEPIPTLSEVLDFAQAHQVGVYLDTKEKDTVALGKLADQVIAAGMADKVILGLWTLEQLKWAQAHHPELATCIPWPSPSPSLAHLKKLGADWVGTLVPLATKSMIAKAHALGLKVVTLEIDGLKTLQEKKDLGIDALQTDNPKLLAELK